MKSRFLTVCLLISVSILFASNPADSFGQATGDLTEEDYARAEGFLWRYTTPLVYGASVNPNWLDGDRFWYRNTTPEGHEFILVDPAKNSRTPAFHHGRLASALSTAADSSFSAMDLPFNSFSFSEDERSITFSALRQTFTCNIRAYSCSAEEPQGNNRSASPFARRNTVTSPHGKSEVFIRDHNLWLRDLASKEETQLTSDGIEDFGYATNNAGWTRSDTPVVLWSPDSKKIATFQHDSRGVGEMYMVSTKVGHPELDAWKYPLPEDSVIFRISRVVIHLDDPAPRVVRLQMPPDQHRSTTTDHIAGRGGTFLDVEWSDDSSQLAFVSSSRDHKEAKLRVADPETGEVRDVMEEVVDTYFESGVRMRNWHFLPETNEVIWYSERTNWGHLYLYDLTTGQLKHPITSGEWVVLQLRHIDKENRKLYFTAGGKEDGDPYYQYMYSVNMDGSGMKLLTPERANHNVTISPSHKYIVDSYSTPTTPPVTVVRDMDGDVVLKVQEADISQLLASGWKPPIEVQVKARDGETDIYGLMYTPTNLDPNRKYPVLNYLYPGPQSGSVGTRSFVASRSDKQAIAELGFIVVEVDAMGTPGRSKSFHDAYYGNMGDNGIPDQIAAIKQLAERNSYMDLDKVGIWGHSGGGFASTAAILRYPDFYKVAVSGAGNHDNRNYEDDWGEKWQGLLTVNEDGTTNYDNQANHLLAGNLKGKLLLAHGLMDGNVPASNTLLVADALVKANKDFDLLVFPHGSHGFGSASQYWMRKRWDYFVTHLLGVNPPKEYEFGNRPQRVVIDQPSG